MAPAAVEHFVNHKCRHLFGKHWHLFGSADIGISADIDVGIRADVGICLADIGICLSISADIFSVSTTVCPHFQGKMSAILPIVQKIAPLILS